MHWMSDLGFARPMLEVPTTAERLPWRCRGPATWADHPGLDGQRPASSVHVHDVALDGFPAHGAVSHVLVLQVLRTGAAAAPVHPAA